MKTPSLLAGALFVALTATASAQDYPNKPIRYIVPNAPGGVADIIARHETEQLSKILGQPFVIENIAGAGGVLAAETCANAPADGYTVCLISHNVTSLNPWQFKTLPYKVEDFKPVTLNFELVEGFMVPGSSAFSSIEDVKKAAIEHPGETTFATLGAGSGPDLFLNWLGNEWGGKFKGIGYKGALDISAALVRGEVQVTNLGLGNFTGQVKAGNLKPLVVGGEERNPAYPDVRTLKEAIGKDYPLTSYFGLAVPAATPDPVVKRLYEAYQEAAKDPAFVEFYRKTFVVPVLNSPEEFAAFIKEQNKVGQEVVKLAGVEPK